MITTAPCHLTSDTFARYQRAGWLWEPRRWRPVSRELHTACCRSDLPFVLITRQRCTCQIEASITRLEGENPFAPQPRLTRDAAETLRQLASEALSKSAVPAHARQLFEDDTSVKVEGLRASDARRLARQFYDLLSDASSYTSLEDTCHGD